jgi:hypothetical protein
VTAQDWVSLKGDLAGNADCGQTAFARMRNPARASASLAEAFSGGGDSKTSPDTGDLLVQIKLVAGARNQHYLQLWRPAT